MKYRLFERERRVQAWIIYFRNLSMRTSTNFFIFTLASADIMTLLSGNDRSLSCAGAGLSFPNQGATFDLSVYWHQYPYPFGESVCRMRAFLSEM